MKLLLFALTGMGNEILDSAIDSNSITDIKVVTRREFGPYPYYDCLQLIEYCRDKGLSCRYSDEFDSGNALLDFSLRFAPDIIVTATYHKILPKKLIACAKIDAVNFHPSLLPFFRGPNPTNWVLICGEKHTGLTVHRLTPDFDQGEILLNDTVETANMDDGQLRKKLYQLAGNIFLKYVDLLERKSVVASKMLSGGSVFPRITSQETVNILRSGKYLQENIQRGLTPYPGIEWLNKGHV